MNLLDKDPDFIWMPCVRWERKEDPTAGNCYNCPIVMSYPTALGLNIDELSEQHVEFMYPFVPYHDKVELKRRLYQLIAVDRVADAEAGRGRVTGPKITRSEIDAAVNAAYEEDARFHEAIQTMGEETIHWIEEHGGHGIVLAGRPYHNDPEINHSLPELISSFGFAVLTEGSVAPVSYTHLDVYKRQALLRSQPGPVLAAHPVHRPGAYICHDRHGGVQPVPARAKYRRGAERRGPGRGRGSDGDGHESDAGAAARGKMCIRDSCRALCYLRYKFGRVLDPGPLFTILE